MIYKEALEMNKKNRDLMASYQYRGSRSSEVHRPVVNHERLNSATRKAVKNNLVRVADQLVSSKAPRSFDRGSDRAANIAVEKIMSNVRENVKKENSKNSDDERKTPITTPAVATKPKFLSTRKGKAIAAGGALATVGALGGAYAYKKHLDKKREEANE